mmetsp:Transcript_142830/g.249115  ORF Transcript_142830/g.249115 Transcript_142830/m.249115 type:complete len:292 (-) Transcript_142830:294-1169(-)
MSFKLHVPSIPPYLDPWRLQHHSSPFGPQMGRCWCGMQPPFSPSVLNIGSSGLLSAVFPVPLNKISSTRCLITSGGNDQVWASDEEVFVGVSEGFLLVCEDDRERSATQPPDSTSEDPASMYISIPTSTPSPVLAHSSWDPVEEFGSKLQCVVFHDLWKKGWYITSGSKFGADFLLYPGDPAQYHATCLVLVRPPSQALTCNEWIAAARVAHGAKKVLLLASQAGSDDDIPSQPDTGPAPAPAPPDPSHDTTESARSPGHELKATGADQGIRQSAPRGSILYVTVQWRKAF